jgi:AbrB family looped-hinge helix DNA binding protein
METAMETVTVPPQYRVVIPKAVRESMRIRPGQQHRVIGYGDRIELVPVRWVQELRGFLKGIDTDVPRDGDRG